MLECTGLVFSTAILHPKALFLAQLPMQTLPWY